MGKVKWKRRCDEVKKGMWGMWWETKRRRGKSWRKQSKMEERKRENELAREGGREEDVEGGFRIGQDMSLHLFINKYPYILINKKKKSSFP